MARLRRNRRREELVSAALGLARQHPFKTISLADVAQAAGVSRQLVHTHFGGEDGLRAAMIDSGKAPT